MNRPYISLDEVTKNEFSITCIYLAGSIIQDAEKREGFDMNKNNYHTHTTRCYHASGKDEEYVKAAIKAGIKELGFSDHTPWHYDSSFKATMRMPESQLDDYIESIRYLKEK